ncbi:hypothetical protein ECNE037_3211, partial [Escherichia coli NE037]
SVCLTVACPRQTASSTRSNST